MTATVIIAAVCLVVFLLIGLVIGRYLRAADRASMSRRSPQDSDGPTVPHDEPAAPHSSGSSDPGDA